MKSIIFKAVAAIFLCCVSETSYAQEYRRITGNYYKNGPTTVMCDCNSQGLLAYVASDGNPYTMTLCFDTEPGSFYEIYDAEQITVQGIVKNVPCANGKSYLVLYVEQSELPMQSRKELVPEFIKQQPKLSPSKPSPAKSPPSKSSQNVMQTKG